MSGLASTTVPSLAQRAVSECLGTAFLLAAEVGSGIMAAKLAGGNNAIALLCNTLPTGAILVEYSGRFRARISTRPSALLLRCGVGAAQVLGGLIGVWAAHIMFELPMWQLSMTARSGAGQWLAEAVATFGLILTIFGCVSRPQATPYAVGLYITSAYWFTSSTSFANPAVTIARSLSDTFAGIAPPGVTAFIIAQLVGMLAAVALGCLLWQDMNFPSKARPH
jgi:glycerol uptake facilitator-like aquaporin